MVPVVYREVMTVSAIRDLDLRELIRTGDEQPITVSKYINAILLRVRIVYAV